QVKTVASALPWLPVTMPRYHAFQVVCHAGIIPSKPNMPSAATMDPSASNQNASVFHCVKIYHQRPCRRCQLAATSENGPANTTTPMSQPNNASPNEGMNNSGGGDPVNAMINIFCVIILSLLLSCNFFCG